MELKPEYKPKPVPLWESHEKHMKDKYGDKVRTIWRVEEWTPSSYEDDIGTRYQQPRMIDKSEWFNTRQEAKDLKEKMKPSSFHNELKIRSKTLYRKWIPAHWQETWI
jgi:hypothetical protein